MLYSAIDVGARWKIQDRRQIKTDTLQKLNTTQKKQTTQNTREQKAVVYTTLSQEMRWAYSIKLPSAHGAKKRRQTDEHNTSILSATGSTVG